VISARVSRGHETRNFTSHDTVSPPPGDAFRLQALGGSRPLAAEMNWLWRGYLAPGQLTLLTSLWKSGKTTLLSIRLSRLQEDGELLGLPVRPARALVLSEEGTDLWQRRRQRLVFGAHTDLISRPFAGKPSDADWRASIDHAGTVLGTEGGRLLAIDTVATLLPSGVEANADCMVRARERFDWRGPWGAEEVRWFLGSGRASGSLFVTGGVDGLPEAAAVERAILPLASGDTCIHWCGALQDLTRDLTGVALLLAGRWSGTDPWFLSSHHLGPNHWFLSPSGRVCVGPLSQRTT
jgi:hypothetical protein